jgi:dolichol-phosphate mannosyltransferase
VGKVVAAEVALISNFIWNELWTFGDISAVQCHWSARLQRLAKFNLICAAGIGLSIIILNIQVRLFTVNVYVGNLIAILIVSFWNFGMNLKFGWNKSADTDDSNTKDVQIICALRKDKPKLE